jgi:broad specificity phosphatase PhoE
MRLLLLRHGQTPSNVAGQLDTAIPGAGLTELGESQAKAVPAALSGTEIDSLAISTLLRTELTAAPLAAVRELTPVVYDGFREIAAGDLEMRSDKQSIDTYVATAFAWVQGKLDTRMPGGEDGHEFFDRFDGALREVEATGVAHAVVVSHGAAIRTWVAARADNIAGDYERMRVLDNTGLVTVEGSSDTAWSLVEWHTGPIGGGVLADAHAIDPTGESVAH